MARTVQPAQYAARENEILDAAQALIYRRGYAQMTIQDLLDTLQISKGAFYHYFGSKQDLLEAVVTRMVAQMDALLQPIVVDASLGALAKLEAVFGVAAGWKYERRTLMFALLEVWYADGNVLVRDKLTRLRLAQFREILQPVIAQGIAEGVMQADYPELAGAMAIHLVHGMGLELGALLLRWADAPDATRQLARIGSAYAQAIERVLGIAAGSVRLLDMSMFADWGELVAARDAIASEVDA